jgi:uncharacterized membrane protein
MQSFTELYLADPCTSLFADGDDPSGVTVEPAPTPAPAPAPAAPATGTGLNSDDPNAPINVDPNARFDQDAVNDIVQKRLAKDRQKHEEKYKNLEKTYQGLLANQALTESQREELQQDLENLQKQHRSKEEQAKHERKQLQERYENELVQYKEKAAHWEAQHKAYLVERSLLEAAVAHDAYMPEQILSVARDWTQLVDAKDEAGNPTGKLTPMVDLPDIDADTLKPIITQHTPMGAIERLKVLQPNLFKANVVSGIGGNSSTGGGQPGANGQIDPSELTTDQWIKQYREDPTKLGLKNRRR